MEKGAIEKRLAELGFRKRLFGIWRKGKDKVTVRKNGISIKCGIGSEGLATELLSAATTWKVSI